MLMTDEQIREAMEKDGLVIGEFDADNLQGASYDLTVGRRALVSNKDKKTILGPGSSEMLHLQAGDFALVITKESVKMPMDMAGLIGMRSTLARQGLMLLAGMQIDPGFEGHLRFGLYNASPRRISLDYGDGLCSIEFRKLSGPAAHPPPRFPELLRGEIPESDRKFLVELETTSLSDIAESMRKMAMSVAKLTEDVTVLASKLTVLASKVSWLAALLVPIFLVILGGVVAWIITIFK